MILVSNLGHEKTEIRPIILRTGVPCEVAGLVYGDACFEGHCEDGMRTIGIERKKVRDMLSAIDTARYNEQRVGMARMYAHSFLVLEGLWRPDPKTGFLMQGIQNSNGQIYWTEQWGQGCGRVMYYKLRRYLFSVNLSGVTVLFARDIQQTAYDIVELYHYFQKSWRSHKSMLQLRDREGMLPTLAEHPSVVRQWAFALDGIGVEHSGDAERVFKRPLDLAMSQEKDWMQIEGIGFDTAASVIRQIEGRRKR